MTESEGGWEVLSIIFGLSFVAVLLMFRPRTREQFLDIAKMYLTIGVGMVVLGGIGALGYSLYDKYDNKGPLSFAEIDRLNLLAECEYVSECTLTADELGELKALRARRDEFHDPKGGQQ